VSAKRHPDEEPSQQIIAPYPVHERTQKPHR
jgi:hypothetical protein